MRVLIIKQGALGDVIMATALIAAIQRAHPGSTFSLLTTPPFVGLFAAWPRLEVKAFPRRGWRVVGATLCWIRRQGFDRIYDLQGNNRTRLLCALSGIAERVGSLPRCPYTKHPAAPWDERSHVFERLNAVLAAAGVAPAEARPVLPCGAASLVRVDDFLRHYGLVQDRFVVMHAGASPTRIDKCWPGFAELAKRLEARGLVTVWLGAGSDRTRNAACAAVSGIDATDGFSVPELAALAGRARFAVTNDSGPMHACAAAGVPVFALFGPSDWQRNHALGQADYVIAGVRLLPEFAGLRTADCLPRISAEAVFSFIENAGVLPTTSS